MLIRTNLGRTVCQFGPGIPEMLTPVWQKPVGVVMMVSGQSNLLEIVDTTDPIRRFPDFLAPGQPVSRSSNYWW